MRILHTSDWHLGRNLHEVDLSTHHAAFLDHLVDVVRSEEPDAVLVAGDVYDRALPPLDSVEMLDGALARLTELTKVIITPGNHDSAVRLGFGAAMFHDRLHLRTRAREAATPVLVNGKEGREPGLLVYGIPYLDPDFARVLLADWADLDEEGAHRPLARSHEAMVGTVMRKVGQDISERRGKLGPVPAVVMSHAFVVGGQVSESERDLRIGGVDSVPHAVFGTGPGSADYVALGHLHGHQRVGPDEGAGPILRYSGSPLAFSFSEKNHTKTTLLVEFATAGVAPKVVPIPTPVPRRLSEISGSIDEVLGPRFEAHRGDWVKVVVTGESRPEGMHASVKSAFPGALEITFERTGVTKKNLGVSAQMRDPLEVVTEFVGQVRHRPPDTDELAVLQESYELAKKAEASR